MTEEKKNKNLEWMMGYDYLPGLSEVMGSLGGKPLYERGPTEKLSEESLDQEEKYLDKED